jgi:hypothetical protein
MEMGINFRSAIVVFGIAILVAVPAAARTYKWVDEDGTTHYSQTKPPHRQAREMSLKSSWTSGIDGGGDCTTVMCRAARLDALREKRERVAREQRDKAARAAAAVPVFPSHVEETDDEKIARLVAECKQGRGSKCDSYEEKRRMLLQNVDLTQAERRALRGLSPANQRRALIQRIPKQYRNTE